MNSHGSFMRIFFLLSIFWLGNHPSVGAQNWSLYKKNDNLDCRFFGTDPLYNIYVVSNRNEVLKYDNYGLFEGQFSNKKLGRIELIEATSPFKILTYYADFQTVVVLNREVNPILTFNLNDFGVARAQGLTMADDGSIWVFDAGTNRFLRFIMDGQNLKLNDQINVSVQNLQPTQLVARQNRLYVNVPSKGIYVFDQFGKYMRTLDIKNAGYFQVVENQIFYKQGQQPYCFNLQTLENRLIKLPEGVTGEQSIRFEKGRLFAQRGTSVDIYEEK